MIVSVTLMMVVNESILLGGSWLKFDLKEIYRVEKNTIILLFVFFVFSSPVHAEIYKWIDEDGRVHFSDRMPLDSKENVEVRGRATTPKVDRGQVLDAPESDKPLSPLAEYTEEERDKEIALLEKRIDYSHTTCKEKPFSGRPQDFWDEYCEEDARNLQKSLDILRDDPHRYFYVINRAKKKAASQYVDNPPAYRPWFSNQW